MKNRILTFIIGFLCGAILTTSGFLICSQIKYKHPMDNMPTIEQNKQISPQSHEKLKKANE